MKSNRVCLPLYHLMNQLSCLNHGCIALYVDVVKQMVNVLLE